jgi:hypothetical protein
MSLLAQVRARLSRFEVQASPRIAVFGDSHTAALSSAREQSQRRQHYEHVRIVRVLKEKDGKTLGEYDLPRFCAEIRRYRENDFVFSAVGGNQYAMISTVQSPLDYDFLSSPVDTLISGDQTHLVPKRAIAAYIEAGIRGSVGPVLREIRKATRAKVYHLSPPPPKEDNEFIVRHFESRFAEEGLSELGPSSPSLRLKCWKTQSECLSRLCGELDIEFVAPPPKGVTPEGFLAPRYYAKDVTHGNRRYGELVLRQILKISGSAPNGEAE